MSLTDLGLTKIRRKKYLLKNNLFFNMMYLNEINEWVPKVVFIVAVPKLFINENAYYAYLDRNKICIKIIAETDI